MKALALLALALLAATLAADAARHAAAVARADDAARVEDLEALAVATGHEPRALVTGLLPLADAPGEGRGVLLAGGGRALAPREVRALSTFAESGGRALVLGDAEAAAAVGVRLVDAPVAAGGGLGVPVATASSAFALPDARPLLDPRPGAEALAWTGNGTFVDVDGDGRATAADAAGPFTVASRDASGRVVVVGSRSLADARVAEADARAFLEWLVQETFPPGTRVLVDASRSASLPQALARAPLAVAVHVAHVPALGSAVVLALVAAGVGAAMALADRGDDE